MIHFDFTITLGQIIVALGVLGGFWRLERRVNWFMVEHEILIGDYCDRREIKPQDLPTRRKGIQ